MLPQHIKYSQLLIDTMNLLHKSKNENDKASFVKDRKLYKNLVVKFIETINFLETEYLVDGGSIYLLFDNPTSRFDLQKSFYYAQRKHIYPKYKEQRAKETKEFYNSFDLIRYYYLIQDPKFISIQIPNVEADDLVKPVLDLYCSNTPTLLVSNDYDWTRYLSQSVDWLPNLGEAPKTVQDFINEKGFYPTEQSIIAYKSIFGDPADNIPKVINENSKTLAEFLELYRTDPQMPAENLVYLGCSAEQVSKYSILEAIKKEENQFKINLQLTSTIPITPKHVQAVTCKGRKATILIDAVEVVLGIKKNEKEFVFGGIRRPTL